MSRAEIAEELEKLGYRQVKKGVFRVNGFGKEDAWEDIDGNPITMSFEKAEEIIAADKASKEIDSIG